MLNIAIASGGFFLISIVTFLNFYRESPRLSHLRDEVINRCLKDRIKENPPISAAELLNLLTRELGFQRFKLVIMPVEPDGYKKSMVFFGISIILPLIFNFLPSNIVLLIKYPWIPYIAWSAFLLLGLYYFLDDSMFYFRLYKMERKIEERKKGISR